MWDEAHAATGRPSHGSAGEPLSPLFIQEGSPRWQAWGDALALTLRLGRKSAASRLLGLSRRGVISIPNLASRLQQPAICHLRWCLVIRPAALDSANLYNDRHRVPFSQSPSGYQPLPPLRIGPSFPCLAGGERALLQPYEDPDRRRMQSCQHVNPRASLVPCSRPCMTLHLRRAIGSRFPARAGSRCATQRSARSQVGSQNPRLLARLRRLNGREVGS